MCYRALSVVQQAVRLNPNFAMVTDFVTIRISGKPTWRKNARNAYELRERVSGERSSLSSLAILTF